MIQYILASSILFATWSLSPDQKEELRSDYTKFVSDKKLCKDWMNKLNAVDHKDAAEIAYSGALNAIWANHASSPFEKLSTFKKGKEQIERAVKMKPDDIEVRFVRYSIQKKAPSMLNYRANITEDYNFLSKNKEKVESSTLKVLINRALTE